MIRNNYKDNLSISERILRGKDVKVFSEKDASNMISILSFNYMDIHQERPDYILIYDNKDIPVGLEHFEFSSYRENKKGSAFKYATSINSHNYKKKVEKFLVVKGRGSIKFRDIFKDEIIEYKVSDQRLSVIDIPTGYTHNITNLTDEDMITIMWVNEPYDPNKPDTFIKKVEIKTNNILPFN